jgi:putative transposase
VGVPWKPSRLTRPQLEERRLEGGRLLAEGKLSLAQVARELEVSRTTISRWVEAFREGGEVALRARVAPGRLASLDREAKRRLLEDLGKGPLAWGYENDEWTLPRVAEVLWRTQRVRHHPSHLSRLLGRLGWSTQRPQARATQRDEAAIERWLEQDFPAVQRGHESGGRPSPSPTRPAPR